MKKTRIRLDHFTTTWMIVALVVGVFTLTGRLELDVSWWLSIHMVALGVLTNAILQWSWYFTKSLLRLPATNKNAGRHQIYRQVFFNLSLVFLIFAMVTEDSGLVVVGAGLVAAILCWNGAALLVAMRSKFGSRFAIVIRYYIAASALLVLGCLLAALIAIAMLDPNASLWYLSRREVLTVAHAVVNALGWVGLSIAGTLVTLGPTMLRTRIIPGAVMRATYVLPYAFSFVIFAAMAVLAQMNLLAGIGIIAYVAALGWGIGYPLIKEARVKAPKAYSTLSVTLGILWCLAAALVLAISLLSDQLTVYQSWRSMILLIGAVGGALQILVGALTYLLPIAVGKGPAALKLGIAAVERGGLMRLTIKNLALVFAVLTMNPWWWMCVTVMYGVDLGTFAVAGAKQSSAGRMEKTANEL